MFLKQKRKQLVRATAGFLTVWLSGLVFLFCCQMSVAQAASTEGESCPLAKLKDSCNKSGDKNESQFVSIEKEQLKLECCGFLPAVFDKARKIEKLQETGQAASNIKIPISKSLFVKQEFAQPKVFRSLILNRENTRLKNCVFRI